MTRLKTVSEGNNQGVPGGEGGAAAPSPPPIDWTNATKANLIAVINSGLLLALAFGLQLSQGQVAAIMVFVNALGVLFVSVTYKWSKTRVPDG